MIWIYIWAQSFKLCNIFFRAWINHWQSKCGRGFSSGFTLPLQGSQWGTCPSAHWKARGMMKRWDNKQHYFWTWASKNLISGSGYGSVCLVKKGRPTGGCNEESSWWIGQVWSQKASKKQYLSLVFRKVRQKQNPEAFSFKPMASDKIDQMEKARKAAEEKQRAEKEEREAKINRQEKLVKFLVVGGFLFVILYNLAKTAQSLAKKEVSVVLTPEKPLAKCEKELLVRNSCRKEVEDLCSALGIKVLQS